MNVKELRELLATFPDDLEVLYCCCSDYDRMEPEEIKVVEAVDQGGYWMRSHHTMSEDNQSRMKKYLLFPGN